MRCENSTNIKIGYTARDAAVRIKEFGLPRPELLAVCPGEQFRTGAELLTEIVKLART